MPREIEEVEEPYIKASIIVPKEYVGAVMELNNDRRGRFDHMEYLSEERVHLTYELPLARDRARLLRPAEVAHARLRELRLRLIGFRPGKLVRVDVLVGGEPVDALSLDHPPRLARTTAGARSSSGCARRSRARSSTSPIQAAIGSRVIARETVKARRKDVLAKCYGGDITRKRKLLEKQKAGKKRMKQVGAVEVPQEAFLAVLNLDDGQEVVMARHLYVHLPVLRAPLRLLRLRHRRRPATDSTARTSTRCSRELELERELLAPELETIFLGGGTPTFTEPAALERLLAALPQAEEVTVEANPETVTPELARMLRAERRQSRVARRAELPPASARRCSSVLPSLTTSGARSTIFVMPDLTTSRSISSTASPARAPPTSRPTSPRRSRSGPSTCPATSSRRSRGRASPTPTGPSSSARPRRWRPTSSSSSSG